MTPQSTDQEPPMVRAAHVLVVLALVAMLIGAVFLLLARDHTAVGLEADQEAIVLDRSVQSWRVWGEVIEVRLTTNATAEVTVSFEETTGTGQSSANTTTIETGWTTIYTQQSKPGENWVVTVENQGEGPVRAAITVTSRDNQWVGGAFVAFGVLGFVFHRIGMRTAD